jgi:hypothetical protein
MTEVSGSGFGLAGRFVCWDVCVRGRERECVCVCLGVSVCVYRGVRGWWSQRCVCVCVCACACACAQMRSHNLPSPALAPRAATAPLRDAGVAGRRRAQGRGRHTLRGGLPRSRGRPLGDLRVCRACRRASGLGRSDLLARTAPKRAAALPVDLIMDDLIAGFFVWAGDLTIQDESGQRAVVRSTPLPAPCPSYNGALRHGAVALTI